MTARIYPGWASCFLAFSLCIGIIATTGCGPEENTIEIPEDPLPLPGPGARLSHQSQENNSENSPQGGSP
ncbi:hypothetical protein HG15A2_35600 [Adhaeretor mobilis]|uniref:Secreted protein n=1 Tax=Adhaeretor mobilis TaxID=1930276 RepID=A0A517MZE3_9BACT|nr:hypothetical protein HG15A2_35600 [Adhaeretor mobilis]